MRTMFFLSSIIRFIILVCSGILAYSSIPACSSAPQTSQQAAVGAIPSSRPPSAPHTDTASQTTPPTSTAAPAHSQVACDAPRFPCKISAQSLLEVQCNEKWLSVAEAEQLEAPLQSLTPAQKEIYEKPDFTLRYKDSLGRHYLSFFIAEDFVYEGYFLDAWEYRMRGNPAPGFALSPQIPALLKSICPAVEP